MHKINTLILSALFAVALSFTIFSLANAGTPAENKAAGEAFLAENAKKPNIKTTASGLQYEVLTEGQGKTKPTAESNVTVHYKGTNIDGKEFDSSYSRGEPTSFPLNGVISGWTEGVQLMTEGAKYRFFIPSNLAYGESGAGGAIAPNEALIFEVELLKIN
jgi:FKBP-type peptidyl-prolyl cis-trans isomerase FkpA